MTLCLFAVMMDDDIFAFCPLCGEKFCNIHALDEHFTIYHDGHDGIIPLKNRLFDGEMTDDIS
jgi:hypothetical protein